MKAILVIEMPKSCNKCELKTHRFGFTTNKMKVGCKFKGDILTDVLSDRPNWCPLKPVHSLKSGGKDYIIYERQFLYDNLDREIEMMKKGKEIYESNNDI